MAAIMQISAEDAVSECAPVQVPGHKMRRTENAAQSIVPAREPGDTSNGMNQTHNKAGNKNPREI
jgi:hypothetical protein